LSQASVSLLDFASTSATVRFYSASSLNECESPEHRATAQGLRLDPDRGRVGGEGHLAHGEAVASLHSVVEKAFNDPKTHWTDRAARRYPDFGGIDGSSSDDSGSSDKGGRGPLIMMTTCNALDVTKVSVLSMLASSDDFHLFVIDEASTDGTVEWLRAHGIYVMEVCLQCRRFSRNTRLLLTRTVFVTNGAETSGGWSDVFMEHWLAPLEV
jgi:hypothetical protein